MVTILLVCIDATVQHVRSAIPAVDGWTALLPLYQANLGRVVLLGLELEVIASGAVAHRGRDLAPGAIDELEQLLRLGQGHGEVVG